MGKVFEVTAADKLPESIEVYDVRDLVLGIEGRPQNIRRAGGFRLRSRSPT